MWYYDTIVMEQLPTTGHRTAGPSRNGVTAALPAEPTPYFIIAVVMLGNFMGPLYSSSANVALPNLIASFGANVDTMEWVITGYMLGYSVAMPLAGWLADTYGRRRIYLLGLAIFAAASVCASLAWSSSSLIAFRIAQAIGGGIISPTGMAIIMDVVPLAQRGKALGLWGMGMMLAPAFAPWISGLILDNMGDWRPIFLMGVPIGLAGLVMSYAYLPKSEDSRHTRAAFDFFGFASLTGALALFLVPLTQGNRIGWDENSIRGSFAGSAVLFAAFLWWELRSEEPMIDLGLFRDRAFAVAIALRGVLGMGYYFAIFLLPLFTQDVLHWDATESGLVLIPGGVAMAFLMPVSGSLADRIGPRPLVVAGMAIAALGTYLFAAIDTTWGPNAIALDNLVRTAALGIMFTPLTIAALTNVPRSRTGRASGVLNTIWQVGGSLGIAVSSTYLTARTAAHYSALRTAAVLSRVPIREMLHHITHLAAASGMPAHAAYAMIYQLYVGVAAVRAYGDTFMLGAVITAASVPIAFLLAGRHYAAR